MKDEKCLIYYIGDERLNCRKRKMPVYGQGGFLLGDHGRRFVCILHFLSKGVRDRPFNSDKVFAELKVGSMDQHQARAELIQFLGDLEQPPIIYDGTTNTVRLTRSGLD